MEPPVRVYSTGLVCGPDGRCDRLAVISSGIRPTPDLLPPLARAILARPHAEGAGLVIRPEGIPAEEGESEREVAGAANALGQRVLRHAGLRGVDGSITGFGGALFLEGIGRPIPFVSLVVRSHKVHPDARAAAQSIESSTWQSADGAVLTISRGFPRPPLPLPTLP